MTKQGTTDTGASEPVVGTRASEQTATAMDAALKAQWLAALRGGEYQQTHGQLRNGGGYCCLGVLCEIQRADFSLLSLRSVRLDGFEAGTTLGQRHKLANMNDKGKSFFEIADYIEANL